MSTNYYVINKTAWEALIPLKWLTKIHVGKSSASGVTFQAVVSSQDGPFDPMHDMPYRNPIDDFSLSSWAEWKELLNGGEVVVIDEYDTKIDTKYFIKLMESQEDPSAPHKNFMEFIKRTPSAHIDGREHYLDSEGYSMCWWEFS